MKVTCGTDIIEVDRIKQSIENLGDKFLNKIYTKKEIEYCRSKNVMEYQHFAARFAAKEAIFKAISEFLENKNEINILISGSRKYIKETNKIIERFLNKNSSKIGKKEITIIDCYEVREFDDNIREILDMHEYILNTSGVHRIEEIFEDYKRKIVN